MCQNLTRGDRVVISDPECPYHNEHGIVLEVKRYPVGDTQETIEVAKLRLVRTGPGLYPLIETCLLERV